MKERKVSSVSVRGCKGKGVTCGKGGVGEDGVGGAANEGSGVVATGGLGASGDSGG